jgi:hypothetical protein
VKPDRLSNTVVGLTGNLGLFVLAPWPSIASGVSFQQGPLIISLTGASDQFVGVEGAAADGVERVTIFLADGQRQRAALRDNVFTALVADAEFPIRVVAYDARNRVVGIQTFKRQLFGSVVPAAAGRNLHRVRRITGDNGTVGTVRIGHAVRGYRCWRIDFSTGQSPRDCIELLPTGPWTGVDLVQPAGRDVFVIGHVRAPAERVQLEFANGDVIRTRPIKGLFVFAIPQAHLTSNRQFAYAVGYSTEGWRIQRQGVLFRANS